jgi:hypothetical protein
MARINTNTERAAFWQGQATRYTREAEKATDPAEKAKWQLRAEEAQKIAANHHNLYQAP